MVDQVRSINPAERMFQTIERVPQAVVESVRVNLAALLGIDFDWHGGAADDV